MRTGRGLGAFGLMLLLPVAGFAGGVLGFAGNSGNDTVRVFDLGTGLPVGSDIDLLPEGDYPYDATLTPDGSELWVTGAVGDGVIVIDAAAPAVTERIDLVGVGEYPVDVIFEPGGMRAFVASRDDSAVVVIDRATYSVITSVPLASLFLGAGKMAISESRNELYVVDWFDGTLFTIDLTTLVPTSTVVGDSLWDLVISPDESTLYVTDRGTDEVLVVDLDSTTVIDTVGVGDDPWGIDITPDGSTVAVANEDSSTVTIFDTTTPVPATVALAAGSDPRDLEITPDGAVAYVPSGDITGDDAVYVIDLGTMTVVDTLDGGATNPNVIAVRPQPGLDTLFEDGFESGDTSAWDTDVP